MPCRGWVPPTECFGEHSVVTEACAACWLGPSGGGFLASARKSIRSSLKGALTAACSRRRAAPLENPPGAPLRTKEKCFGWVLRRILSGAIATGNRFIRFAARRTAPLENPLRRAFTLEKQCFSGILSKTFDILNSIINRVSLLFSHSENSLQKPKLVFYSAPVRTLAWNTRAIGYSNRKWPKI